jgi:hypothetical protein
MPRFTAIAILAIGCSTGLSSARNAARPVPLPAVVELAFTSQPGTVPVGQVVDLAAKDGAPVPVRVKYVAGPRYWLSVGIAGTGASRALSVQPTSHRLGPGVYRASIEVFDAGDGSARRVEVTLTITGRSGGVCPPGSTLRYAGGGNRRDEPRDFGKTFFAKYCTMCHGSTVAGNARLGAPPELNWDSIDTIRLQRNWIDAVATHEPGAVGDDLPMGFVMPPRFMPMRPTRVERNLLARWIACGAP